MAALKGPGGPSLDEIADDDDPRIQQVYRRLRKLSIIGGLTMGIGFLSVMSVIAYRLVKSSPASGTLSERTLALPEGGRVVATLAGDGRLVLTVEAAGRTTLHVFDALTLRETGRLAIAPGGPSAPPLR